MQLAAPQPLPTARPIVGLCLRTHVRDATNDLVTRYDRTSADTPVVVDDREIGMADAAILDDTLDLLGADLPDRIQKVRASASDH